MEQLIPRLIADSELGKLTRRQLIRTIATVAAAGAATDAPLSAASGSFKTVEVTDLQICGPGLNATHPLYATKRSA